MIDTINHYSFDDWILNRFWREKGYLGFSVCNDSERYLELVSMGKMSYEVLNEIQDAQRQAYEYMINSTLEANESYLKRDAVRSLDFRKLVEIRIKRIDKYILENENLHYEVIKPRLHRHIKIGAKFMLPEEYLEFKKNSRLDAFLRICAPYQLGVNGKLVSFPTEEQRRYAIMEINVLWQKKLKDIFQEIDENPTVFESRQIRNSSDTLDAYLQKHKAAFNNEQDYKKALTLIDSFFSSKPTSIKKPIFVKRGNTKKLARTLGEIWQSKTNDVISYDYLIFCRKTFSIFSDQVIEKNVFGCPLYKYLISRT